MPSTRPKLQLPLPVQGIRADLDDFHLPPDALRSSSYNWMMRDGKLITRPGKTALGQSLSGEVPLGIISFFETFGISHQVFASQTRWYRYNRTTSVWDDISNPALLWSGNVRIPVNFRVFNSGANTFLLGVNGVDPPLAWNTSPTTNQTALFGGSAPTARCIAIVADRVLLGHHNVFPGPSTVDVSAFQDHTSGWGVTQTANLIDSPGFIIEMREMGGNRAAIYKNQTIYLASGTGGLAPIRFDIQTTGISGPFNSKTVVDLNTSTHAVFARDRNLYLYDGLNYVRHPSSDAIRTLYEENASEDSEARQRTHAYYDRTHNELWWYYTREGLEAIGPRDAIMVNLGNGSVWKINFTKAQFSFTASHFGELVETDSSQRHVVFVGNSVGRIFLSEGSQDLSLNIDARMDTGMNALGDPTTAKTVEETQHYFGSPASTQSPSVSLLTSEAGEGPNISATQSLTVTPTSSGPYVTGHRNASGERVTAHFVGIRIEDSEISDPLEYRGTSLTVVPRGNR